MCKEKKKINRLVIATTLLISLIMLMVVISQIYVVVTFREITNEDIGVPKIYPDDAELEYMMKTYLHTTKVRYNFANKILISGNIRRNAAFLIGAVCLLIGCLFILNQVKDSHTKIDATFMDKIKASIATSSPGMFMMFIGVIIIVAVIVIGSKVVVNDPPLPNISIN